MRARHPAFLPRAWLMTDERMGEALWAALRRVPPGGGVVFRHHHLNRAGRLALWLRVRRIGHARRLVVISAGSALPAADGTHKARGPGLRTWPAHDRRQALAAKRAGATLVFVSPVYATRSHPGARALGPMRAATVSRGLGLTTIALGGMDARRWRWIRRFGFGGWAAVDAWLPAAAKPLRRH